MLSAECCTPNETLPEVRTQHSGLSTSSGLSDFRGVRALILAGQNRAEVLAAVDRAVRNRRPADGAAVLHDDLRALLEDPDHGPGDRRDDPDDQRFAEH